MTGRPLTDLPADQARREYADAVRRLAALPHTDAIPSSWRPWNSPTPDEPITLTEVVDLICRHVPANTLGAPSTPDA